MPLHEYRDDIVAFSEMYQMCTEFHVTPEKIRQWKEADPYEFKCFRSFMSGMAQPGKARKMEMEDETVMQNG